jgi:hypothetical protein
MVDAPHLVEADFQGITFVPDVPAAVEALAHLTPGTPYPTV